MKETSQVRFATLYGKTIGPLRRYLARMLSDDRDAQDLAHDAFARVYKAMEKRWIEKPEPFVFTTARRLALNEIRRRSKAPLDSGDASKIIEFTPSGNSSAEQTLVARQEREILDAAIADLPPGCRQVLLMCRMEQLPHAEIATRLGIAISTVEKQHARALRLLRVAMQAEAEKDNVDKRETGGKSAGEKTL